MNKVSDIVASDKTLRLVIAPRAEEHFEPAVLHFWSQYTQRLIEEGFHNPNTTVAYGNTFFGVYNSLEADEHNRKIISQGRFFELDEVYPTSQTYRSGLERSFLKSAFGETIPAEKWFPFQTENGLEEARTIMRNAINIHGPLHLAVLGMGPEKDPHYGLVRHGVPITEDIIITDLSEVIIASHQEYQKGEITNDQGPAEGISFGPGSMPDNIIVAAKGAHKAQSVYDMFCAERYPNNAPEISTTFLRDKKHVTVIVDQEAARQVMAHESLLPQRTEVIEFNP